MDHAAFMATFGGLFEHSPWVAERAWQARPYSDVAGLHAAMMDAVRLAPRHEQLALIRAHPELAGREAQAGALTASSTGEQGRLGFDALPAVEFSQLAGLNRDYRARFGFPAIVALTLHATRDTVLRQIRARLANDTDTEIGNALEQIGHITAARLARLFMP